MSRRTSFPKYAPILIGLGVAVILSWVGNRALTLAKMLPGGYPDDGRSN